MTEKITFINRAKRFGPIDVHFADVETAREYSLKDIKTEKWRCFPMYTSRSVARVRVGEIHPDVQPEWIVAAITKRIKLEDEVLNVNGIKK